MSVQVKVTSRIHRVSPMAVSWEVFTDSVDELYARHDQKHDIDWSISLEALQHNGSLYFPNTLVELVK